MRKRRKMLKWSQPTLAEKAKVNTSTIVRIEADKRVTSSSLKAVRSALEEEEARRDLPRQGEAGVLLPPPPPNEVGFDVAASAPHSFELDRATFDELSALAMRFMRLVARIEGRTLDREAGKNRTASPSERKAR